MTSLAFSINNFPREILIEIFRYIQTLHDRHNAMLVCKYWFEILQDPCFMLTCPEILTMRYYDVTASRDLFKTFFFSNRKFNQIRLEGLSWSDNDDALVQEFVQHLGREARIVHHDISVEWKHYFLFFPKMIELRVDLLDYAANFEQFPEELNSVIVETLDPKLVDLSKPIFKQIKCLKSYKTLFKIVPDEKVTTGLNIELDELLKCHLRQICDLKHIKISTRANLLRQEPLTVRDITKLVITEPIQVEFDHLRPFSKLRDFRVDYNEDSSHRTMPCKFLHETAFCSSIKKLSFELPRETNVDFCKECFEIMLKSCPNLQSLRLENGQYSNRATLLSLIAQNCPDLKTLKLLHKLSPHDHAVIGPEGALVLGIMNNLTKIHLYNLVLDNLRDWPSMPQLKAVTFIFTRFPEGIESWKAFVKNSPNIKKLKILSRFGLVETEDPIPSHRHIEEIVKGLEKLQDLELRFNKLTEKSLEPIFMFNRSLKSIILATMGAPKPIFSLNDVFELFKRVPSLEKFYQKFIYFVDGEYKQEYYQCVRYDYQSPQEHLREAIHNYKDLRASVAYVRAFLMPNDDSYKGWIRNLASEELDDVNLYLEMEDRPLVLDDVENRGQ